jgi:hypothetical protein
LSEVNRPDKYDLFAAVNSFDSSNADAWRRAAEETERIQRDRELLDNAQPEIIEGEV